MRVSVLLIMALVSLPACKQLDRTTKRACNTTYDCVGFLNQCVRGECVGAFGASLSSDPVPAVTPGVTGPTAASGPKPCLESVECGAEKVCTDGACSPYIERDYEQTRSAFRFMLCQTLADVCGETKMVAKYGSDTFEACQSDPVAPWGLGIGPSGVAIRSWSAVSAARCVADTRNMLRYGLQKSVFASLPEDCTAMGYTDFGSSSCELGQIECYSGYTCSKPPKATGAWPCVSNYADFGETCFDRTTPNLTLTSRIKNTCASDHFCELRNNGTCKKRIAPGKACLLQYYDNDPVFDPCTSGYMCAESSGTCVPFVARCPLDEE